MKRRTLTVLTIAMYAALLQTAQPVFAQEYDFAVGDTVFVSLTSGENVFGVLTDMSDETISVRTDDGIVVTIARALIVSISEAANRAFRRFDPNISRLFFGPTGRSLGAAKGYVSIYELFFAFIGVGVGPNINLAGGMTLVPGVSNQVVYIAPKITFLQSENLSIATGLLAMKILSEDDTWGLVYGAASFGPAHRSLTAGLAYGFLNGDFGKNPVIMLGYEAQTSESFKFITENYLITGETVLITAGVRIFGDRFAGDIAFVTSPDAFGEGGFPLIPWLGFAYNFGK